MISPSEGTIRCQKNTSSFLRLVDKHPERLRELFHYDCLTGELKWAVNRRGHLCAGAVAGWIEKNGYRYVRADGDTYLVHRIAWAISSGEHAPSCIDHRNGVRSDNRLCNLRLATPLLNQQNRRNASRGSSSGVLGVTVRGRRFESCIKAPDGYVYLGRFGTKQAAHEAYLEAKRRLHEGCTL